MNVLINYAPTQAPTPLNWEKKSKAFMIKSKLQSSALPITIFLTMIGGLSTLIAASLTPDTERKAKITLWTTCGISFSIFIGVVVKIFTTRMAIYPPNYADPIIANQISLDLQSKSLSYICANYYDTIREEPEKYFILSHLKNAGFISTEALTKMDQLCKKQSKLDGIIAYFEETVHEAIAARNKNPELAQDLSYAFLDSYYETKRQVDLLEQEWIAFKENIVVPYLPHPATSI